MPISHRLIRSLLALLALLVAASAALAQSGAPAKFHVNDQKAGSVLVYNFFTSNVITTQDTRISLTNTNTTKNVSVHLYFVDGATCIATDSFICLTQSQTATFLASDVDPSVTGYIIAVAVDSNGFPTNFNFLIGEEFVKLDSGHQAKFNAVAIAALFPIGGKVPSLPSTARLDFDGVSYEQVPRMLALSNIPSPVDLNSTLLVINRIGGDLTTGAASLSGIFAIISDDQENPFSAILRPNACQLTGVLSNAFIRSAPPFTAIIPSGHSGWMKFSPYPNVIGILGAAINFNPKAATERTAFNGGDNLHHLELTTDSLIIPLSIPSC